MWLLEIILGMILCTGIPVGITSCSFRRANKITNCELTRLNHKRARKIWIEWENFIKDNTVEPESLDLKEEEYEKIKKFKNDFECWKECLIYDRRAGDKILHEIEMEIEPLYKERERKRQELNKKMSELGRESRERNKKRREIRGRRNRIRCILGSIYEEKVSIKKEFEEQRNILLEERNKEYDMLEADQTKEFVRINEKFGTQINLLLKEYLVRLSRLDAQKTKLHEEDKELCEKRNKLIEESHRCNEEFRRDICDIEEMDRFRELYEHECEAIAVAEKKKGVCYQFACLNQFLAKNSGIDMYFTSGKNHAFNICKLGEDWFVFDLTHNRFCCKLEPYIYATFNVTDLNIVNEEFQVLDDGEYVPMVEFIAGH